MKRPVMILFVLTIFFCTVLPAQAANLPPITGVQFFPADHIWNVPVNTLPVDPMSNTYINSANSSAYLYVYKGYYYNIVDSSTPKQYMTSITYASASDNVPVPIPKDPLVETGSSDHGMDIIDKDSKKYYQIFNAKQAADGTWSCGSLAVFDLSGYALRPDGWTSDEAGLPPLPGMLRYDEVATGEIDHALRGGLWVTQRAHVWPARHDSGITNTAYSPLGQRFRLKASVDISGYTPQQQVILKALKKYGMMVATQTGQKNIWALSAVPDSRWDSNYASFSRIKASDFEAVDVSSLMIDKDSGKARITPITTPTPQPTLSSIPSITITSPNGGETWQRGTSPTVSWSYTGSPGSYVKILLVKAGTEVGTIAASAPIGSGGKGTYIWPVSSSLVCANDYKVIVQSISQPAIQDSSNTFFTIIPAGTTTPSITVTSPNGGESWVRGSNHAITWTTTGSAGSSVKIELLKAEGVVASTIQPDNGAFSWTISTGLATGSDYKIRITSTSNSVYTDTSNNYFTITSATTTPSLTVTAPNGGESWVRGSNHAITWTSSGTVGSNVKVEVLKAGVVVQTLSTSTPNNGAFSWTISTGLATGSDYKIRITSTSNSVYTDTSNNYFTITSATTTPSLTVTAPNGGESWYKSTSHTITWSYVGSPGSTVKIVLLKGGTEVSTLSSSVPLGSGGKGSYSWIVPTTLLSGSDYKVSVQSISQPTIKDTSNANFIICWP
jgi:hypothetical protein